MDLESLQVLLLHNHPEYLKQCCEMINDEWPRSETARMMSLQASCDRLPTSLILVNEKKLVLGHCKLSPIPSIPESCFIETVVISKSMRGKKLGTFLMKEVENHCMNNLKLKMAHLSTKGQESFYAKLGYTICKPISIYGSGTPNYSIPTTVSHKVENTVPIKNCLTRNGRLPPPPPPMPRNENLINNNVVKPNKTYMCKYFS